MENLEKIYVNRDVFKKIIKEILFESITKDKDLIYKLLLEVIEDMGMINAIKEGEDSEIVDEESVLKLLRN